MNFAIVFFLLFLIYIIATVIETNKLAKNNSEKLDIIMKLLENGTNEKSL